VLSFGRKWPGAIKRSKSRIMDHKDGAISVRQVVEASLEIGTTQT